MRYIAMVDTDPAFISLMKALLEKSMLCEVQGFQRPSEVLQVIAIRRPDLLTTSIMLPEFNGYELIRRIRSEAANVFPIVVISSAVAKLKGGLPAGVTEFINKPVDPETLVGRIRSRLDPTQH